MQTTPPEVDELVVDFCAGIRPGQPVYVPVLPVEGGKHRDCYANVARQVEARGGGVEYGWAIWLDPDFIIEAEHHAVWVSPQGDRIDVSPRKEGRILFLPDPDRVYKHKPIANIRRGLTADPRMQEWLALHEQLDHLRLQHALADGTIAYTPEMQRLQERVAMMMLEMGKVPTLEEMQEELNAVQDFKFVPVQQGRPGVGRNDPCPCGSGKKFKKCHLRLERG